jgi:cofilin
MSGIGISEECVTTFNNLKLGKHRYVIYKINDTRTEVVVDKIGPSSDTYSSFLATLPEKNSRYAVFNYEFEIAGLLTSLPSKRRCSSLLLKIALRRG